MGHAALVRTRKDWLVRPSWGRANWAAPWCSYPRFQTKYKGLNLKIKKKKIDFFNLLRYYLFQSKMFLKKYIFSRKQFVFKRFNCVLENNLKNIYNNLVLSYSRSQYNLLYFILIYGGLKREIFLYPYKKGKNYNTLLSNII